VSATPSSPSERNATWAEVFRQPAAWRILVARFLFDPVFYFYMFWIPQYLARERGFSLDEIGAYYWIPFLALGLSNISRYCLAQPGHELLVVIAIVAILRRTEVGVRERPRCRAANEISVEYA